MTTFPAAAYLSDALRTQSELKAALEAFLAATRQLPGAGGAISTLTIASGSIAPTAGAHIVGTEGAAIADDLANIAQTNLPDGSLLLLQALSSLQVVVLKHGAGGAGQLAIADAADLSLIDPTMSVLFRRAGSLWQEVGRFYGNQAAALRTRYSLANLTGGPNVFTKTQSWAKGADLASATTLALGTDGNYFVVTGTTPTTGISDKPVGTRIVLQAAGSWQLTYHAANLILQNAVSFNLLAGDVIELISIGTGQWREINRQTLTLPPSFYSDPESMVLISEDFLVADADQTVPPTKWQLTWGLISGLGAVSDLNLTGGVVRVTGDGAAAPSLIALPRPPLAAKLPSIYLRWAQFGTFGTTFIGLSDAIFSGTPVAGIYFRHTAAGNLIAVCRDASTESILDTGVAAANGVFHSGRLVVTPSLVSVWVDGLLKGTIAANIPAGQLKVGIGSTSSQLTAGVDADYHVTRGLR